MDWYLWVFYLAWFVIGFAVLYKLALDRGRNPILWGIFGAITFLIALVAILIVGHAKDNTEAAT